MTEIQKIYLAPVCDSNYYDDEGVTQVTIEYNNNLYSGAALLNPEDKGFYSRKVGYNIALSRARMQAIRKAIKKQERKALDNFKDYYRTGKIHSKHIAFKALAIADDYRICLQDEKSVLKDYLYGQERAITSIKRYRDKLNQDKDN